MNNSLLKNKVFRVVMATDFIQQTSIWIRNIAVLYFVMEVTNNNSIAVSMLTVLEYLPMFMFSFIGGTMADRWDPKKTMIFGDLISSLSIVVILIFMLAGLWEVVFVCTFLSAIATQFSVPSSSVMFKRHIPVEQVTSAIGISQTFTSLYIVVGPIIGTFIYTNFGIKTSLIIISILFFISAMVQINLPSGKEKNIAIRNSIKEEIYEGFRYVKSRKNLVIICVVFICIGLSQGIMQPLSVYVVMERLGLDKINLQWFTMMTGIGLFLGAAITSMVKSKSQKRKLFIAMICFATAILIEALSNIVIVTAVAYLIAGISLAFVQVICSSLILNLVEENYVGRTSGIITPILTLGVVIGSAGAGLLMNISSLIVAYIIASILALVSAIASNRMEIE